MDSKILVLFLLAMAALPACCSAEQISSFFFNADDADCPGANMELGGCWIERDGMLACKWEEKYQGGPKLQYEIWHFTSNQKARQRYQSQAFIIQEQYDIVKDGISGLRYDIREFTSENNYIVFERRSQYISPSTSLPDYGISYANNYNDTIVTYVSFGGYNSEQQFEADKAKIKKCISDALERKIPGITAGQAAAEQRAVVLSGEKEAANQNAPGWTGGSNPVSDTLGSAESIVQDGLTPLGGEMLNGLNNIIGDLTGDKPVPPEVEDALAQAGIECNERDPTTRDKCFSDAALESKNPLICIKMHTDLEQIRGCSGDVIRSVMDPDICENLPASGKMYDMTREQCYAGLYRNAPDVLFCNSLAGSKKTECLSVFQQKKQTENASLI